MKGKGLYDPFFYPKSFEREDEIHKALERLCEEFHLDAVYLRVFSWISKSMGTEEKLRAMERDLATDLDWERERQKLIRFLEKDGIRNLNKSEVQLYPDNSVFDSPEIRIRARGKTKKESITIICFRDLQMARDGAGAYWLSATKEIKNPYYGDAMLTCGETKEVINK